MKRLMVLSLLTTVMVLAGSSVTLTYAQTPPNDLKPTFISPTPGLYVNGWPAFTVSYPKEWVELSLAGAVIFYAGGTRPDLPPGAYSPSFAISVLPSAAPLVLWKDIFPYTWTIQMRDLKPYQMTDVKVLSAGPSQLKDGTPAREVEFEFVSKYDATGRSIETAAKLNGFDFMTKKERAWVAILICDDRGRIGEDLKKIAHSLTFQPDREKPVQVPPDVRAFLDMYCTDIVSRDLKAIMEHYSDRFLFSGTNKGRIEQWFRFSPDSPLQRGDISQEATVTVFEPHGDKAYLDGFLLRKERGDAEALKAPMAFQQIINEHGEWKWFGNQK
jgi:hypothetical protein